jgi:hypothetical protein
MTEVAGTVKQVGQGLTQKTYNYDALDSLVDIVTNTAGTFRASLCQFRTLIDVLRRPSRSGYRPETEGRKWRRIILSICVGDAYARLAACQFGNGYSVGVECCSASAELYL